MGLTIRVESGDGAVTAFHIPSFFTPELVPEERWELYQHVRTFAIGDHVRATGEPGEHVTVLTDLELLEAP